jgi:hypothetical protein
MNGLDLCGGYMLMVSICAKQDATHKCPDCVLWTIWEHSKTGERHTDCDCELKKIGM